MARKSKATYEVDGEPLRCRAKSKTAQRRCRRSVVPGRSVCRYHGGLGGRPIEHGRYSKALGRFRGAYLEARDDPTLMDLRETMALLDVVVQKAAERAGNNDAPEFRSNALELYGQLEWAGDDVERQSILDRLGELLRSGVEEDKALKALAENTERLAKRQERAWDIKLSAANAINARDMVAVLMRFADIVLEEAPKDAAGRIINRIDGEIMGTGPTANRLAAGQ